MVVLLVLMLVIIMILNKGCNINNQASERYLVIMGACNKVPGAVLCLKEKVFFASEIDQFLSDFHDFCTIRMRPRRRIRMVQKSSKSDKY